MDIDHNVVLVGCGNMGAALLRGWLAQGIDARRVTVVDTGERALGTARTLGFDARPTLDADLAATDVLLLAVKPQQLDGLMPSCRLLAARGALVLSIAAGKPIAYFERALGERTTVVRAMPNTPAAIGQGITALTANAAVSTAQRGVCETLMHAVGEVVWLEDEALMDAVTAVSGSGPAYVFLLVEALAAAAREVGLEAELADRLARATVAGAGAYAKQASVDASVLREQVTSPGGTTQAALEILLADDGLKQLIARAVRAATERGRELA